VDASISKTVNAPATFTVEDVKKLYNLAYELGCKGVTFMRAGSRPGVLETIPDKPKVEEAKEVKPEKSEEPISRDYLQERPVAVKGSTYKLGTPVGSAFVTINETEDRSPLEVFINVGKAGSDVAAMAEALGRTISAALRFRGSLSSFERAKEIAHQLAGIGGRRSVGFGPNKIRSLPDAVSFALQTHCGFKVNGNGHVGATSHVAGAVMAARSSAPAEQAQVGSPDPTTASAAFDAAPTEPNGNGEPSNGLSGGPSPIYVGEDAPSGGKIYTEATFELSQQAGDICPSCGASALVYEEGCSKCYACGHSEC
jgi:ribonucleoside-diphosphate reductase alpha chain